LEMLKELFDSVLDGGEDVEGYVTKALDTVATFVKAPLDYEDWWRIKPSDQDYEKMLMAYSLWFRSGAKKTLRDITNYLYEHDFIDRTSVPVEIDPKDTVLLALLMNRAKTLIVELNSGTETFLHRALLSGVRDTLLTAGAIDLLKQGVDIETIMSNNSLIAKITESIRSRLQMDFTSRLATVDAYEQSWTDRVAALKEMDSLGLQEEEWVHMGSDIPCDLCQRNIDAGIVKRGFKYETVFGPSEHGPAHAACLPGDTLVTSCGRVTASSERLYQGEMILIETANKHSLRCTPNHPILTTVGWKAAHLLKVGDDVICVEGIAGIDDNEQHVPTRIEDVARSLRVSTRIVPTSSPDFHGDGAASKVAIIRTNGFLGSELKVVLYQRFRELRLSLSAIKHKFLASLGALALFLEGPLLVGSGTMSSTDQIVSLAGGQFGPSHFQGSRKVTDFNTSALEKGTDFSSINLVESGKSKYGLAGQVLTDKVVRIVTYPFSGHVYNLQTESEWYVANTIVTHNCHCETRFVPSEVQRLIQSGEFPITNWRGA